MNKKMQSQDITKWVDNIRQALENLDGEAWLQDIYMEIEKLSGAKDIDSSLNWRSSVRTTIY